MRSMISIIRIFRSLRIFEAPSKPCFPWISKCTGPGAPQSLGPRGSGGLLPSSDARFGHVWPWRPPAWRLLFFFFFHTIFFWGKNMKKPWKWRHGIRYPMIFYHLFRNMMKGYMVVVSPGTCFIGYWLIIV